MDEDMEKEIGKDITKIVIGVIVFVSIVGSLMAMPYLIVRTGPIGDVAPNGLDICNRTNTSVTFLVSSAPPGAMVHGSIYRLIHEGDVAHIDNIRLYNPAGIEVAFCDNNSDWQYINNASENTLEYTAGMKIEIESYGGISTGDRIVQSSNGYYFATNEFII